MEIEIVSKRMCFTCITIDVLNVSKKMRFKPYRFEIREVQLKRNTEIPNSA